MAFTPTTKTAITTIKDVIVGKALSGSTATTLTPGGTVAIDASLNNVFKITPAQAETWNISNMLPGQRIIIIIVASSGTRVCTFGTGFKPVSATISATDTKSFVLEFISDGTNAWEASRTTAIT
jgi:hypothetical protein